jgi:hypothetical protein
MFGKLVEGFGMVLEDKVIGLFCYWQVQNGTVGNYGFNFGIIS